MELCLGPVAMIRKVHTLHLNLLVRSPADNRNSHDKMRGK